MSNAARADALLANLPREGRGRLKVFLGAAPGVGKTFAMLQAAHAQQRQGVQVLAGMVETHGRAETEALLGGLRHRGRFAAQSPASRLPQDRHRSCVVWGPCGSRLAGDGLRSRPNH
ncbi:hypothetical protein KU43P_17720 [Pseudomonas sp. KU43P]|nr:hypothetical protein [Pseudomonas sp. KU43P]BBH45294.1 hypothetical protein KU43P_17710 [Pseudomonas sp. KU43P]BBH45295.1 hypothetical protein KU43P_17720 [Pseudomonas sp. KU43P]